VLKQAMTYVFSLFAHVFWPIYIPFAFRVLETTPWRRTAMLWFQAVGLAVGLYLLYFSVAGSVVAEVVDYHIVYNSPHFSLVSVTALYVVATCFTGFVSSHTFVRLLSFIATYFFYTRAFVSVWCFFAAILSLLIYLHLRYRRLGGFSGDRLVVQRA
jgi:cobalamin synthase